jgi:hypothetical protein
MTNAPETKRVEIVVFPKRAKFPDAPPPCCTNPVPGKNEPD